MSNTARLGRDREHRVVADMESRGWIKGMRASASKGAADLLMAHPVHGAALVQVGSKSKTLGPAERERLCYLAELCGALPLLAIVAPRRPTAYWLVTRDTPSRWTRWDES